MILFTSRSSSLVVAAITFWAVVTLTSLPNVVRAQSLGMGTCAMPNDFDRDTQGCCVTGAGPTVVTSATEGCCRLSSGFAQVLTLANEGCCLTGPGQQEKIDLTVFGYVISCDKHYFHRRLACRYDLPLLVESSPVPAL